MPLPGEERDNLTKIGLAILDEVQDAVRIVIESNIPDSLEKILNKHRHRIFHCFKDTCHNKRCSMSRRKILTKDQMQIVFNKSTTHTDENLSYCCSTAIQGIQTEKMDLTFLNAFLKIFPEMIYWQSCLKNQNKPIQDLLNDNKHKLYHLYKKNRCCECLSVSPQSIDGSYLTKPKFEKLFHKQVSVTCGKKGSPGDCICIYSANNINQASLAKDDTLTNIILNSCCLTKQCVEALVKVRNEARGHCINSKMSVDEFKKKWEIIENRVPELLKHGLLDGPKKEETVKKFIERLQKLKGKPMNEELHRHVIEKLLQQQECEQQLINLQEQLQSGLESLQSVPTNVEWIKTWFFTLLKKNEFVQEIQYIKELLEKIQAELEYLQSIPSDLETFKKGLADLIEKIRPQSTTNTPQLAKTDQAENSLHEEVIYKRHGEETTSESNAGSIYEQSDNLTNSTVSKKKQDRNTNPDLDTDTVPEDEPGIQDRMTNSDLDYDAEPYLAEEEPRNQGAEAVERRDERSVDRKEQTYIKTGVTGSEQIFRQDRYAYDILVLHSEHDEEHVNEMIDMIKEKVALPDITIASVGENIPPGANIFDAFHNLMDASCSLLLFITPNFHTDCWNKYRLQTQLAHKMGEEPCIIPVLFGQKTIGPELREVGHLKPTIFFKEKDDDQYKSFIRKITYAIQQRRDKGNK